MANKHLEGKGEYTYDYQNDLLLFKIKEREYDKSMEFDNFVADFDTEGFLTGIRVFDASKLLHMSKITLKSIKNFQFKNQVENKVINIQLRFEAVMRNKLIVKQGQDFVRETNSKVRDSNVIAVV